jgi:hypothetical protein
MARPRKDGKPTAQCKSKEGRPPTWTSSIIEREAEEFLKWLKLPSSLYFEEFAVERGYPAKYLSEFSQKNEKFREALEYAHSWQKCKLLRGSLLKKLDGSTARLLLSGYGVREEQVIEHKGNMNVQVIEYVPHNRRKSDGSKR